MHISASIFAFDQKSHEKMNPSVRCAPILLVFCSALSANAAESAPHAPASSSSTGATKKETLYFREFDNWRRLIKERRNGGAINPDAMVSQLNEQLQSIVGLIRIPGFPNRGTSKIDVQTLWGDACCDYVPGLDFQGQGEMHLWVSTNGLLSGYLARHPGLQKTLAALSKNDGFYLATLGTDAALTNYADIPLQGASEQDFAYAFLGGFSQDIAPTIPDRIIVVATHRSRIFLLVAPTTTKAQAIAECEKVWDDYSSRADKANDLYRLATRNGKKIADEALDKKLSSEGFRLQNEGHDAYRACYNKASRILPFFPSLTREAQALADMLQAE